MSPASPVDTRVHFLHTDRGGRPRHPVLRPAALYTRGSEAVAKLGRKAPQEYEVVPAD